MSNQCVGGQSLDGHSGGDDGDGDDARFATCTNPERWRICAVTRRSLALVMTAAWASPGADGGSVGSGAVALMSRARVLCAKGARCEQEATARLCGLEPSGRPSRRRRAVP
jgi:hypothetical protein